METETDETKHQFIEGQPPTLKIGRETLHLTRKKAELDRIKQLADSLNEKYGHDYRKGKTP